MNQVSFKRLCTCSKKKLNNPNICTNLLLTSWLLFSLWLSSYAISFFLYLYNFCSISYSALATHTYGLREENDSLRWQLDAYRNEVELLKKEQEKTQHPEDERGHDQQLGFLQQSMHSMQQVASSHTTIQHLTLG